MAYPGLSYPTDNNYINQVKERGYFILVDRNAPNIILLAGGDINRLLTDNNKLLFVFGVNIAGTRQDIIDALKQVGYSDLDINQIIGSAISIDNVNTSSAQQWIVIFKNENLGIQTVANTQAAPGQITTPVQITIPVAQPKVITPVQITIPVAQPKVTTPVMPNIIRTVIPKVNIPVTSVIIPKIIMPVQPTTPTKPITLNQPTTFNQRTTPIQPITFNQPITLNQPITPTVAQTRVPTQPFLFQAWDPTELDPSRNLRFQDEPAPNLSYPVLSNYSDNYINYLRQTIHQTLGQQYLGNNPNFEIPPNILQVMFTLYDDLFFKKQLTEIMARNHIQLNMVYGDKLTKTGGYCDRNGCVFTIKLSSPIILNTFRKGEKFHISNGLQCYDRLACLMNVFEHELIHFLIEIVHGHTKGDPIYKSHGIFFQQLMRSYFGHTEFRHTLNKNIETPGKREDFRVGDYVTYQSKKGAMVTDRVNQLNPKTADVGKMRVPYPLLRLATVEETTKATPTVDELGIQLGTLNLGPTTSPTTPTITHTTSPTTPTINQRGFREGDIISYTSKGQVTTGRISKVNVKTYSIGKYNVPMTMVRAATDDERNRFLRSPEAGVVEKTRADFYTGQTVQFTSSKTGQVVTGIIEKLNPARAVISGYTVPYAMLRAV
ncbi:Hypothetical protein HVR_LOCUS984 [uncultured virus]|nr:Hypothetical protein HVR_LOCUS984 [uncultured virus]